MRILICFISFLACTGCASIIDFMIPKHPNSEAGAPELVCVRFQDDRVKAEIAPLIAVAAPILAGIVVDQVSKGLEAESKLYKASYSGRASSYLLKVVQPSGSTQPQVDLFQNKLAITRYYGDVAQHKGCGATNELEQFKTMNFVAEMKLSDNKDMLQITPTVFELKKTKAKVSIFNTKVDLNVQVTLTTYVKDGNGKVQQADITQSDFPIGKVELSEDSKPPSLGHLQTSLIPLPIFNYANLNLSEKPALIGPLNMTITVMESNDFGDVIAKSSKTVSDNKEKIIDAILKTLGFKKDEK